MTKSIGLKPNSEIIGNLLEVNKRNDTLEIVFYNIKEIQIPKDAISYDKLESLIDQRIGIGNFNGEYKMRKIRSRKQKDSKKNQNYYKNRYKQVSTEVDDLIKNMGKNSNKNRW